MKTIIDQNFLLFNENSRRLYFEYAADLPIIDFHCHLSPADISSNRKFSDLTEVWLAQDHYKWRAMRANGIDEHYITGTASSKDKFRAWAATVPHTLRNPLYHWSQMELKAYFDIDDILDLQNADLIYGKCNEILQNDSMRVKGLLRKMNVELICTTDDPIDTLEEHSLHASNGASPDLFPTFRPDSLFATENLTQYSSYIHKLARITNINIANYEDLTHALSVRMDYFNDHGCRLSDHGFSKIFEGEYDENRAANAFKLLLKGHTPSPRDLANYHTCLLLRLCSEYGKRGWTQQFHLGAIRNNNSALGKIAGADAGFDSMGDYEHIVSIQALFDRLEKRGLLAKTILYNNNPADNEAFATMLGNFAGKGIPGRMQYGAAWWFLDNKEGIEKQLNTLSSHGLLSRFVGMVTDSRSFLSYQRHDYFRRILCNMLGTDMKNGLIPSDFNYIGGIVKDICYLNPKNYFSFQINKNRIQ